MKRWLYLVVLMGLAACAGKADSAGETVASGGPIADSGGVGDDPPCTDTQGELVIAVTVDGYAPADTENYRALVRSGEEAPIEVTLSDAAEGTITLEEGAYSVSARALDESAGALWVDFVAVLACARTELTVDMVGIGR